MSIITETILVVNKFAERVREKCRASFIFITTETILVVNKFAERVREKCRASLYLLL